MRFFFIPVKQLRNRLATVLRDAQEKHCVYYITKNGKLIAAVYPINELTKPDLTRIMLDRLKPFKRYRTY